jgi:uncharacterized protein involved in exopolysaccharide biosynthesis
MSLNQILSAVKAQKAWVIVIALIIGGLGTASTLRMARSITSEARLVLDIRPDPMLAGFATAIGMATQIEILKSDKVSLRAAELLLADKDGLVVRALERVQGKKAWTQRSLAALLQTSLTADAVRGSNIISVGVSSTDGLFAMLAANAIAKAAIDVSLQLRTEPTRESADWLAAEAKGLRQKLEAAQAKLASFQQANGIVGNEEKVTQELTRLNALEAALAQAEAQQFDGAGRSAAKGGSSALADVTQAPAVQSVRSQLTVAQGKLVEMRANLGSGHPRLQQQEAQVDDLKRQLDAEIKRATELENARTAAANAATSANVRAGSRKVAELRRLLDTQKAQVLAMRSNRDEISRMARDVDSAQRAYDTANSRAGQLALESQNTQAGVRLLNIAADWTDTSRRRMATRILLSVLAGIALGLLTAVSIESRDRRVRSLEDMVVDPAVQVIGVLRPTKPRNRSVRFPGGAEPRVPLALGTSMGDVR